MMLSVVINTLNEEGNIQNCLEAVKSADEIIIVDMHSSDRTVEIALKYTEQVFFHERTRIVETARNFAISKATGDWILIIDADERVTSDLWAEVNKVIQSNSECVAFRIQIRDYMFGRWVHHGSWKYQKLVRLFMRNKCRWPDNVHAVPIIDGEIGALEYPMLHYSHLSIERFVKKLNTYTTAHANEWYEQGVRTSLPGAVLEAAICFVREYFLFQGFRDGGHGFILAVLMSVYWFVERVKLWELWYKHDRG